MSFCSYFFITTRGNLSDPRNNLMLQCTLKYLGILLPAVYRDNEMASTYFICSKNQTCNHCKKSVTVKGILNLVVSTMEMNLK